MSSQFGQHTTGAEVVEAFLPQTTNKTIVLTGCTKGTIGGETALALAHGKCFRIILAGRTESKVQALIDEMKKVNSRTKYDFVQIDFSDLDNVRTAVDKVEAILGRDGTIDAVINTAGILGVWPYQKTKQGIEMHFGVNHVGPFLWTNLLLPRIEAAGAGSRIVMVASTGYLLGGVRIDDVNWDDGKTYQPWLAYSGSKAANVLYATYLASHLKNVEVFAVQPGQPQSNLLSHITPEQQAAGPTSWAEAGKLLHAAGAVYDNESDEKTLEEASSTSLCAAFSPEWNGQSGLFLRNCRPYEVLDYCKDPNLANRLWRLTEELVGQKFPL